MAASFAEEYEVDYGVYLFLGYSKKEEKLLKPYTKTASLVDAALVKLGKLVRDTAEIMNGVSWLTFEHSGLFWVSFFFRLAAASSYIYIISLTVQRYCSYNM